MAGWTGNGERTWFTPLYHMKQEGYNMTVEVFEMQNKKVSKEKLMELTP